MLFTVETYLTFVPIINKFVWDKIHCNLFACISAVNFALICIAPTTILFTIMFPTNCFVLMLLFGKINADHDISLQLGKLSEQIENLKDSLSVDGIMRQQLEVREGFVIPLLLSHC